MSLRFLLVLLLCAPPVATQVRLTDLSEGGFALGFRVEADEAGRTQVSVTLGADASWDVLDFEVAGAEPGAVLRFRVPAAPAAWRPAYGVDGRSWAPATLRPAGAGPAAGLAFAVTAPAARFLVRLVERPSAGRAAYYTYGQVLEYLGRVASEPLAQFTQVGTSGQGRPLYRIVIDAPSSKEKKTVLMVVRQHGDEYGSSYLLEGALDLLLSRNGLTPEPELLQDLRWIIYPLANPDGTVNRVRTNASGVDLNRDWDRNGANPGQSPEIFAIQADLQGLHATWPVAVAGDHHGWGNANHGGYRYAQGASVSFVTGPEHDEAQKDTEVVTLHDPTQFAWQENGGVTGMLRAEMYHRYGYLLHTPEYNGSISSAQEFHAKGQAWVRAMHDTLFAPRFTDDVGAPVSAARLPKDALFVTVDDLDENQNAGVRETVSVTVSDVRSGDVETLVLEETDTDTGVFRNANPLPLAFGAPAPGDGRLTSMGGRLTARYVDDDYPRDSSQATLPARVPWSADAPPVRRP